MKKVRIEYKLYGCIDVEVPNDFIVEYDNVEQLILKQSDKDLIAGIATSGSETHSEIDGDAIALIEYMQIEEEV